MKKKVFILSFLALHTIMGWSQKVLQLESPNQKLKLHVTINDKLQISISQNGQTVVKPSTIGLEIKELGNLGENPKLTKVTRRSIANQTIASPVYKKATVNESYNEMTAKFKGNYAVIFRCYDQGIAYRFQTQSKLPQVTVMHETADYRFPAQSKAYAAYSNRGKDGDFNSQYLNSFENTYDHKEVIKIKQNRLVILPFLVEMPQQTTKICITESDLYDYPGMFLHNNGSSIEAIHAPAPKTTQQGGHNNLQKLVKERHDYIAQTSGKRSYPWRIFAVAEKEQELLDNDLVFLLGTPSPLKDLSWIKPGKVAWDWWNNWNITNVDFRAGINNETYKYYIDFASKNGIEYVILDEGWAVNKKADMLQIIPQIDLKELTAYAKSKHVDLILWAGYWAFHRDMEKVVKHYAEMGIKGFKVDFLDRDDQEMINFMWEAAELCAKHQMLVDYHGACKPFGLQRTYPNVINFEGVNGLEQLKWKKPGYDQVTYDLIFPFIRMLAGPVDYTQGAMRNATKKGYAPNNSEPMSQGTRCRQLAEYIIFESPFNMLCDTPTNYIREQECTSFIASIPTVWDETVALESKIGEYISMARRHQDTWYVGAINGWKTCEKIIDLSFLPNGNYQLEVFRDGINADRNAADYKREIQSLPANKQLKIKLYPGGGYIAKITKQ